MTQNNQHIIHHHFLDRKGGKTLVPCDPGQGYIRPTGSIITVGNTPF